MSADRDYSCVRLERQDWLAPSGELMTRLRAITDQKTAPVVITVTPNGTIATQFVSQGNCKTVVSSMPAAEFDTLDILVSPRGSDDGVEWPIVKARK